MTTLPSRVLVLCDGNGEPFGFLRLAPTTPDAPRGECIFDIRPSTEAQGQRSEVRWLGKRGYERFSEHRFKVDERGAITVSQGNFEVVLDPDEQGGFVTRRPAPPVTATWG